MLLTRGEGAPRARLPCGRPRHPGGDRGAGHAGLEHDARGSKRAVFHRPGLERELRRLRLLGLGLLYRV